MLTELERALLAWQELVPPSWRDDPRRRFVVRSRCGACGGSGTSPSIRADLPDPCHHCDGGSREDEGSCPSTVLDCEQVARNLRRMELAEALAAQAADRLEPGSEPVRVRWLLRGVGRRKVPLPLRQLARRLGAPEHDLSALHTAFVRAEGPGSPVAPLLVLADLGFRLVDLRQRVASLAFVGPPSSR